jgi:hypothetical protein
VTPARLSTHGTHPEDDEAYDLVVAVAAGTIDDVGKIAEVLSSFAGAADD